MSKNEEFELIINEMELNVYNYKELQDYRKRLENIQEKSKDKSVYEINDKITFEILFLYYRVQDGKLVPFFSNEDYYFPDFSRFNDECVIYLDYRFKNTKNYLLKSLYSLILWNYYKSKGEKKILYLYKFVDSSLNIIPIIQSKQDIHSFDYWTINNCLKSAFSIGYSIDYNKSEIKGSMLDFIYDDSIEIDYVKKDLIEFILHNKKILKNDDLGGMDQYCWKLYLREERTFNKIDFLKLGQKVDNRIQQRNYDWDEEIAKCYEELMDENESFINKSDFCISAIQHYRKSGNKNREAHLLNKLERFNKNIELGVIKVPIDLKPLEIFIDIDLSERILYTPIEMINYLSYSLNSLLINRFKKNKNIYENLLIQSPILMGASKKYFDSNRNIRKKISSNNTVDERINDINEMVFDLSLEIINKTYLDRLFIFSYENKILSYKSIITFLSNFFNFSIDNERNMLQFLDPLINNYFHQIDIFLKYQNDDPIFIMFIDSICSKIEYLLKTICSNNGINIITVQQDGLSSRISLEKLFNNDDFKNLILESDYHFLKYVLIEPGLNLRNKSAHGLDLSIYNFSNANLLLLCLLRIIKYL